MTILYSVVPGDAIICKLGDHLDGCGTLVGIRWDKLCCSDCVWIIPGELSADNEGDERGTL